MMKTIIVLFMSLFVGVLYSQDDWSLEKEKDGIQVYTKSSADYRMKASKAVMILDDLPEAVLDVITDIDNYPNWIPSCEEASIVEHFGDNEFVYYALFSTPWPAASRDLLCRVVVEKEEDAYVVQMYNEAKVMYAEIDDVVRIPIYRGYWKITPLKNGVEVINEYQTDPGGSVPDWMIQGAAVKEPMKTFTALKEYLLSDYDRSSVQSKGY